MYNHRIHAPAPQDFAGVDLVGKANIPILRDPTNFNRKFLPRCFFLFFLFLETNSMASDTFESFPKFPLEIRRAVWLHTLPRVQNFLTLRKHDALAQKLHTSSRGVTRCFEEDPVAL